MLRQMLEKNSNQIEAAHEHYDTFAALTTMLLPFGRTEWRLMSRERGFRISEAIAEPMADMKNGMEVTKSVLVLNAPWPNTPIVVLDSPVHTIAKSLVHPYCFVIRVADV